MKALVLLALLLAPAGCVHTLHVEMPAGTPRSATHLVQVTGGAQGSGVMIAPGVMVTAAHVVTGAKDITVGPNKARATVTRIDEKVDIAVLRVEMGCPCVPLADTQAEVDEQVVVVGYPLNSDVQRQVATYGRAQGVAGVHLVLTAAVAPGNSGGGVFIERDGQWRLAGVLVEVTCLPGWFGECVGHVNHLSKAVELVTLRKFVEAS